MIAELALIQNFLNCSVNILSILWKNDTVHVGVSIYDKSAMPVSRLLPPRRCLRWYSCRCIRGSNGSVACAFLALEQHDGGRPLFGGTGVLSCWERVLAGAWRLRATRGMILVPSAVAAVRKCMHNLHVLLSLSKCLASAAD